ncbi:MAG: NADPH-dependent FMN reductase [Plectolyngbya sp. WJT66-NPBG17]|jgi:FMN reductase|nr:NADPH-dependent FMN reductase [Plectolyngbya sp. WJT66-NPBG17]MBW4528924.1 NADPH-dependent FMN reductase [Phormidium tanganyikae FI6-MK23]
MPSILAIAGSPTHPSRTHGLVEIAAKRLQQEGFQVDIVSVRDFPAEDLVFGRYDSAALNPVKALLEKADGVIVSTPIYKASYTGVLKAFLDLLPQKSLNCKVVLPIATGGTIAHLLAIEYALKPVLAELGARHILGTVYAVDQQIQRLKDGSLQLEPEIEDRLYNSLQELSQAVRHLDPTAEKLIPVR